MYFKILIVFLCHNFFCFTNLFGQDFILKGKLFDHVSEQPITFATVVVYEDASIGSVTNMLGEFTIRLKSSPVGKRLFISSVNFLDTLITVDELNLHKDVFIYLKPDIRVLDEIFIVGKSPKTYSTGKGMKNYKFSGVSSNEFLFFTFLRNYAMGNTYNIGPCKIQKLKLFLFSQDSIGKKLADKFIVRIYGYPEKMKHSIVKPNNELSDLAGETFIVEVKETGWHTIDLATKNIFHNGQSILIAISRFDFDTGEEKNHIPIPVVQNAKNEVVFSVINKSGYSVGQKKIETFLMELEYIKI